MDGGPLAVAYRKDCSLHLTACLDETARKSLEFHRFHRFLPLQQRS
jgi:hypothetical protein